MIKFLKSLMTGGGPGVISELAGIVAEYIPNEQQRQEFMTKIETRFNESQQSARSHDSPMNSGLQVMDALVNGINRMIRPAVTIGLLGGVLGWWALPDPKGINPIYFHFTEIVLLFWFGGRALFKDLPAMIKYLKKP